MKILRGLAVNRLFIVSLAIYNLALAVPDAAHLVFPAGTYGFSGGSVSATVVTDVLEHSAAARAGMEPGDRIETRYLNLHERLFTGTGVAGLIVPDRIGFSTVPFPGERVTLHVVRHGSARNVTLVARPVYLTRDQILWSLAEIADRILAVTLGLAIVLARPRPLTWIFYLFMLGRGAWNISDYFNVLPAPLWIAVTTPLFVWAVATLFMPALLWLHFPTERVTGWRRPVCTFVIGGVIAGAIVGLVRCLVVAPLGASSVGVDKASASLDVVGMAVAVVAVIAMWMSQHGFQRRLYFWLMLIAAYLGTLEGLWSFTDLFNLPPPPDIALGLWLGPLQTLFIAYAVMRYQMFDIEFVLSRTLLYAIFAVVTIGILAGIDTALASQFHGTKVEVAIDIAVALALGFILSSMYRRAVDLIDRLLFFRRYDSRRRLKATFAALQQADSHLAIESAVTVQAAEALRLASAMFFRKVSDGGFLRQFGTGWTPEAPWHLLPGNKITELLATPARSIDLRLTGWPNEVKAPASAAFAIPMRSDTGVVGITFYGDRIDGVAPSPDEVKALIELSRRAAEYYAFLERASIAPARREVVPA